MVKKNVFFRKREFLNDLSVDWPSYISVNVCGVESDEDDVCKCKAVIPGQSESQVEQKPPVPQRFLDDCQVTLANCDRSLTFHFGFDTNSERGLERFENSLKKAKLLKQYFSKLEKVLVQAKEWLEETNINKQKSENNG